MDHPKPKKDPDSCPKTQKDDSGLDILKKAQASPWTESTPNAPAEYGVLDDLEGTWENHNPKKEKEFWGLHTTCLPAPGSNSETIPGKFHFICEQYYETLKFKKVPGSVRNRGGTNEQFCGAMEYHQKINRVSDNGLIHQETGMYLYMKPIFLHPAAEKDIKEDLGAPEMKAGAGRDGPVFVPTHQICRSGTIPHGSTIHLIGKEESGADGPPLWPPDKRKKSNNPKMPGKPLPTFPKSGSSDKVHLAISDTMGGGVAPGKEPWDLDGPFPKGCGDPGDPNVQKDNPSGNVAYTQRIVLHPLYPYSVRPDLLLRDATRLQAKRGQQFKKYRTFSLDSASVSDPSQSTGGPQGGVLNIPFVKKYCNATRVRLQMWIETVTDEDGKEVKQLQYEQIVAFEFGFGTDGGTTVWPHIQVNTLRKKAPNKQVK